MVNKPVYEIVKVLDDKVFIVGLGNPCITYNDNIEFVHEELSKLFPNKRIIFIQNDAKEPWWYEIIEKDKSGFTDYELAIGYEIGLAQYNEELPDIKPWDKILSRG